jgi:hypothetical protein
MVRKVFNFKGRTIAKLTMTSARNEGKKRRVAAVSI